MNKDKFLTELRGYLSILERQEQDDILEEYAQHIDMKMQKGLSEEEAIGDFGSIEQLAAEILEAYHVNPEFRRQSFSFKLPKLMTGGSRGSMQTQSGQSHGSAQYKDGNVQEEGNRGWQFGRRIKNIVMKVVCGIRNAFRWMGGKCRAFGVWLMKPFKGRKTKPGEDAQANGRLTERTKEMGGRLGRFCKAVGRGIAALWRWCIRFCTFWLKFMWNAAWLLFALLCGGMAMFILMGAGAVLVFLAQGYPLIGLFLICLGGLLCLGALAYGAFTMLIRKEKIDGDDDGIQSGKGVEKKEDVRSWENEIKEEDIKNWKSEMTEGYGKEAAYE